MCLFISCGINLNVREEKLCLTKSEEGFVAQIVLWTDVVTLCACVNNIDRSLADE